MALEEVVGREMSGMVLEFVGRSIGVDQGFDSLECSQKFGLPSLHLPLSSSCFLRLLQIGK